jgi:hypothetical protein
MGVPFGIFYFQSTMLLTVLMENTNISINTACSILFVSAHPNPLTGGFLVLDDDNKQFAYAFLADRESYHSQKETSSLTIFLLEAGLFGALWTTSVLADCMKVMPTPRAVVPALIVFIWCLFHATLRWQLRNRRIAALQVATLLHAIRDHLEKRPEPAIQVPVVGGLLNTILDYFIPQPKSTIIGDDELQQFPEWYRLRYLLQQKNNQRANFGEVFPTYGSIVMLISTLVYVFIK